jgi:hypothetical protein
VAAKVGIVWLNPKFSLPHPQALCPNGEGALDPIISDYLFIFILNNCFSNKGISFTKI